jgi:DNA-binding transcriptional regulator YdaS (Cro superfamily)
MEIEEIIALAGGVTKLGRIVGRDHSTVVGWKRTTGQIPVQHARAIGHALNIPLHEIRPDVWSPSEARDAAE